MNNGIYEAMAYIMRYWFIFVIAVVLIAVITASAKEYQEKKRVLARVGVLKGYLEVVGGPNEWIGERLGIKEENIIGRNSGSDIYLNDMSVEKAHALLYKENEDIVLSPLSNMPVYVNNWEIQESTKLKTGDVLSFGDIDLKIFIKRTRIKNDY